MKLLRMSKAEEKLRYKMSEDPNFYVRYNNKHPEQFSDFVKECEDADLGIYSGNQAALHKIKVMQKRIDSIADSIKLRSIIQAAYPNNQLFRVWHDNKRIPEEGVLVCDCPICNSSRCFRLSQKVKRFECCECSISGNIANLVSIIHKKTQKEAVRFLEDCMRIELLQSYPERERT